MAPGRALRDLGEVGEALKASHRIVVMHKGVIVREFDARNAVREEVMAASGESVVDDSPIDESKEEVQ